jgi:hypothetical protein
MSSRRLLVFGLTMVVGMVLLPGSAPPAAAGELPPLPGPGLNLPVDADGDGESTYSDRYAFNLWLAQGGSMSDALSEARVNRSVLDLSEFFVSRKSALSLDAPVTFGGGAGAGAALAGGGGCTVEFTRRIPPSGVPNQASSDARTTPDGRFMVFSSAADLLGLNMNMTVFQIYRVEFRGDSSHVVRLVSRNEQGNPSAQDCSHPAISDDGSLVVFDTVSSLCPTQDSNGILDVYLRDLGDPANEETRLMSFNSSSKAGNGPSRLPSISGDGTTVVFTSSASDLDSSPACTPPCPDGIFRVPSDGTGLVDRVSLSDCPNDPVADAACRTSNTTSVGDVVDCTGNLIVFQGAPTNWDGMESSTLYLPDSPFFPHQQVFVRDLREAPARTFLLSGLVAAGALRGGNGDSIRPSIDADGTRVVFSSRASDLISGDTATEDVFFVNLSDAIPQSGDPCFPPPLLPNPAPKRISTSPTGAGGNFGSFLPMLSTLSPTGEHRVAFASQATNLVGGDGNGRIDVFVRRINANNTLDATVRLSVSATCGEANGDSTNPDLAHLGSGTVAAVYQSRATNLIVGDGNSFQDVFETKTLGNFERGDANGDGEEPPNIADVQFLSNWLFLGGPPPMCMDAADTNDSGAVDLTDVVYLSNFLFLGGPPPPPPGPFDCGTDPTNDPLVCERNTGACD